MNLRDREERSKLAADLRRQLVADNAPSEHLVNYIGYFAKLRTAGLRSGMRGFGRYSINNLFLLNLQERRFGEVHRGLYAGVAQWRTLGRELKAGAKPKLIWAFVPPTTKTELDANGNEVTVTTSRFPYRVVEVFDYTDTFDPEGGAEPDWAVPMQVGCDDTFAKLLELSPVPVRQRDLSGAGEHGHLSRHELVIDVSQPAGNRLGTLVHELAHHFCGHLDRIATDGEAARAVCEQEAELAVYLFLRAVGLDETVGNDATTGVLDYLRSWNRGDTDIAGHKARVELLHERIEAAWVAVDAMLNHLNGPAAVGATVDERDVVLV